MSAVEYFLFGFVLLCGLPMCLILWSVMFLWIREIVRLLIKRNEPEVIEHTDGNPNAEVAVLCKIRDQLREDRDKNARLAREHRELLATIAIDVKASDYKPSLDSIHDRIVSHLRRHTLTESSEPST